MGLVIRRKFDWEEDLEDFDWVSICRKSSISGKHRFHGKLSLIGWLRKVFGIRKGEIK